MLRDWLLIAVDSDCLADWEFESLVGRARVDARRWIEAGLPGTEYDESLLDPIVTMLSILAGGSEALQTAARGSVVIASGAIERLLEKLCWSTQEARSTRGDQQSSVTLRPGVPVEAQ